MTLIEGSFGQAAQNHHFKRARYRRLWRQYIQDHLIAAVQNIKKIIRHVLTNENMLKTPDMRTA
ncbi:alanine-alpha-ketoisovalerate/valine-pyruvate aminotransferase [Ereboglobus sp. PH5-10]|nr:alanine-alpha-ketoisovalerate/valine-pyruvate aminotransferase [Ereboglobus sp. PH5-10]